MIDLYWNLSLYHHEAAMNEKSYLKLEKKKKCPSSKSSGEKINEHECEKEKATNKQYSTRQQMAEAINLWIVNLSL